MIKIVAASLVMGVAAHYTAGWLTSLTPGGGELAKAMRVFGAIGVALAVLAASARVLRIQEFTDATARVVQRFRR